jgi:hypothetical protein
LRTVVSKFYGDMLFETLTYNDLKEIRNLQPEGWPDIVSEFESYIDQDFCHPIKTRLDGKIVGIGTLISIANKYKSR